MMETKHFSLLVDRNPISDGHHLIVPRLHLPSFGALPEEWDAELASLRADAEQFLARPYGHPVSFERSSDDGQGHAHLHVLPGIHGIREALVPDADPVASAADLRAAYSAHGSYIWYGDAAGALLSAPSRAERGFLRRLPLAPSAGANGATIETGDAVARRMRSEWQDFRQRRGDGASDVIACFLWRAGQVCLLRRSMRLDSAPGRWHIVAGYLPRGSEPIEHAITEVGEETGLAEEQVRLMASGVPLTIGDPFRGIRWRIHPFLFEVVEGEPRLNWEHDDLMWVAPEDIASYGTMPWLPPVFYSLQTLARDRT